MLRTYANGILKSVFTPPIHGRKSHVFIFRNYHSSTPLSSSSPSTTVLPHTCRSHHHITNHSNHQAPILDDSNTGNTSTSGKQQLINLIGLPFSELKQLLLLQTTTISLPDYKLKQIYTHMYQHGVQHISQISTLSKQERIQLSEHFTIDYEHEVHRVQTSSIDQTIKYLLKLKSDEKMVESVLMEFEGGNRRTMCLSSQIGCSLNCRFCKTGTQPIERNMTSSEIVGQVMLARHHLGNFPLLKNKSSTSTTTTARLSHLVFMGEGEPLFNFKNVSRAIQVLTDPDGCAFSKRKVTVSTSGVVNLIPKVVNDLGVELAISLHATTNEMRDYLVPLNKTFPIEVLFDKLHSLNLKREITFEYVMLNQVNDFIDDAKRLIKLLKGIPCSVNLIAFNEWEGSGFQRSSEDRINQFSQYLYKHGIAAPIRFSRGTDIDAACGQLKSSEQFKESFLRRLQERNQQQVVI